jgi:ankyrin repeat protein
MNEGLKKALQEVQKKVKNADISGLESILAESKIPHFRLLVLLSLPVSKENYPIISSKLTEAENKVLEALKENNVSKLDKLDELDDSSSIINALLIKALSSGKWDIAKEFLNNHTIDFNYEDMDGKAALHIAASIGNLEAIQLLFSKGANINASDEVSYKAIHYAAEKGKVDAIKFLLKHGHPRASYESALYFAVKSMNVEAVELFLKHGVDVNARVSTPNGCKRPLDIAAQYEALDIVELLLANNAGIDGVGSNFLKVTALLQAAEDPNKLLLTGATESNLTKVKIALGRGADFELIDPETGKTTLELAQKSNNPEIVELLEYTANCLPSIIKLFQRVSIDKIPLNGPYAKPLVQKYANDFLNDAPDEQKKELGAYLYRNIVAVITYQLQ